MRRNRLSPSCRAASMNRSHGSATGSTKSYARKAGRAILPYTTAASPMTTRELCVSSPSTAKLSAERDDRRGVKLIRGFLYGFKNTIAAVALSSVIACGVCAATGPAVTGSGPSIKTSVDRTHKSDRLPQAAMRYQSPNNSSSTETATRSRKMPPLGCNSAFSPITAPSPAQIFKRCMV